MQRVDGYYLYMVGSQIHPLADFRWRTDLPQPPTTLEEARFPVYIAEGALEPLLHRTVFKLKTSVAPGQNLLTAIRHLKAKIENPETDLKQPLDWWDCYSLTTALTAFEAVLGAELGLSPLYVVTQKAGFDTAILVENGAQCFPAELANKVPEAIRDLQQGTKCIALEVPTAAGFHLHRATESVLRRYWDAVTQGAARPNSRNIGDYLKEMDDKKVGDVKVKAAMRHLKDFHRNPLIHPEHTLENVDEAIALMNGVHTVIVHMLREIPEVETLGSNITGALAPPPTS